MRACSRPSVAGHSAGKESSNAGGAPCSTRSPAKTTVASPSSHLHHEVVVGVPAAEEAQHHLTAADVEDGRVVDEPVGRVDRRRAHELCRAVVAGRAQLGDDGGPLPLRRGGQRGRAPPRSPDRRGPEGGIAEAVVVVGVGVHHRPRMRGHRAHRGDQLGGLAEVRPGVDDEAGPLAQDQPAVEVQVGVAADEHPVGHLLPAGAHQQIRIGRPRPSRLPSPTHRPSSRARRAADQAAAHASSASITGTPAGAVSSASSASMTRRSARSRCTVPRAVPLRSRTARQRPERQLGMDLDHAVGRGIAEGVVQRRMAAPAGTPGPMGPAADRSRPGEGPRLGVVVGGEHRAGPATGRPNWRRRPAGGGPARRTPGRRSRTARSACRWRPARRPARRAPRRCPAAPAA